MKLTTSTRYDNSEFAINYETVERFTFKADGKTWRISNVQVNPNRIWIDAERQTSTGKDYTRGHGQAFNLTELPDEVAGLVTSALAALS